MVRTFAGEHELAAVAGVRAERQAITLEDKEVEFETKLGPMEIKRKFKLQDMVFGGQLEL